jgi:hypothetical protein
VQEAAIIASVKFHVIVSVPAPSSVTLSYVTLAPSAQNNSWYMQDPSNVGENEYEAYSIEFEA